MQGAAEGQFDNLWSHFRGYIEDEVYENKSLEREGNRKSLASSWSSPRTCWPAGRACPAPMGWFRAKLLYSLCPADASFWQVFHLRPSYPMISLSYCLPAVLSDYGYTYSGRYSNPRRFGWCWC